MRGLRPHVLGIDDAPFEKGQSDEVPIVGVMMEGASLVEGVAVGRFAVDGEDATAFLTEPLRVAHLIGAAMVKGQSRGRV